MNLLISGLKLPVKLLVNLVGSKQKRIKTEREKKQLAHVRNFAPTHYSWQKSAGKKLTKRPIIKQISPPFIKQKPIIKPFKNLTSKKF